MTGTEWLAAITLASAGIEKGIELLKWLKEHQPDEVTQIELDEANKKMNEAIAAWDAA